ncbi:hypothetical protein NDU88_009228 [Pleurodeles waltl]|uniref:Uncharacterized protein n=1 Tax=Pleurodeles waltl TaxID=8319 RepID=A0AAV7RUN3_PLEWA|nr:hypothetical protein NDU88_009228 [Pleurodeles waltl]
MGALPDEREKRQSVNRSWLLPPISTASIVKQDWRILPDEREKRQSIKWSWLLAPIWTAGIVECTLPEERSRKPEVLTGPSYWHRFGSYSSHWL